MGIESFFAHSHLGGEIVHGDIFEAMGHEMVACAGEDAVSDWIKIRGLGEGKRLEAHTLWKLYKYFTVSASSSFSDLFLKAAIEGS